MYATAASRDDPARCRVIPSRSAAVPASVEQAASGASDCVHPGAADPRVATSRATADVRANDMQQV